MENLLLEKLKAILNTTENPNEQSINIKLNYDEIVHLYALEQGHQNYIKTLNNELMNSFEKVEKLGLN